MSEGAVRPGDIGRPFFSTISEWSLCVDPKAVALVHADKKDQYKGRELSVPQIVAS
jgi:hypothetical protein